MLLSKSRTPNVLTEKNEATDAIIAAVLREKGMVVTVQAIMRKIAITKARVKSKADVNQTGNRKRNLSPSERRLWDLLDGDSNPSITKLSCEFFF